MDEEATVRNTENVRYSVLHPTIMINVNASLCSAKLCTWAAATATEETFPEENRRPQARLVLARIA